MKKIIIVSMILFLLVSCSQKTNATKSGPVEAVNAVLIADAPVLVQQVNPTIEPTAILPVLPSLDGGRVNIDGVVYMNKSGLISFRAMLNHTKTEDQIQRNIIASTYMKIRVNEGTGKLFIYDKGAVADLQIDLGVKSLTTIHFEFVDACNIDYVLPHNSLEMTPSGVKFSVSCTY